MKRILITGSKGFIGKSVLNKLITYKDDYSIDAIVRPRSFNNKPDEYQGLVNYIPFDLADSKGLMNFFSNAQYDFIIHIGAIRGGRKFSKEQYYLSNVVSTEIIISYCQKSSCKLLFCSSVGVFGAIPLELPANNNTQKVDDNYYHYTKIEAEKRINRALLTGLTAAILRPSITYGTKDRGFPYQMVKMISKKQFPLISKRIWIHLCHIDTITDAFIWLIRNEFPNGLTLNVADREPVQLKDLVNFISRQLYKKNYTKLMQFDQKVFDLALSIFKWIRNELWISRVELISRSWFYEVSDLYSIMNIRPSYTIPGFEIVIKDYSS